MSAGPDSTYPAFDFDADLDSAFHSEAEPDLNLVAKMIGLHADPDPDLQFFLRTRSQE